MVIQKKDYHMNFGENVATDSKGEKVPKKINKE